MKKRTVSHSARYGQACFHCFKAKSRCIAHPEGGGCQRCRRLMKSCGPSDNLRSRKVIGKETQDSESHGRIAILESKIESLVAQLESRHLLVGRNGINTATSNQEKSQQQRQLSSRSRSTEQSGQSPILPSSLLKESVGTGNDELGSYYHVEGDDISQAPNSSIGESSSSMASFYPSCLDTFRSRMLPFFPFMHLPVHLTATQLREERPLLFRAILCVAWPSPSERRARGLELKRVFCEAAFLRPRQSNNSASLDPTLDLLLALLTYIAWDWDHLYSHQSLSRLMMLSVSLVGEMHLDRPAPTDLHTAKIFSRDSRQNHDRSKLSLECQRAALGCFVLSSVVSSYFDDVEPLGWTPTMEQVRVTFSTSTKYPSDTELASQALLELLASNTTRTRKTLLLQAKESQTSNLGELTSLAADEATGDSEKALGQLQEIRNSFAGPAKHHQYHINYVELLTLETIRTSSALGSGLDDPIPTPSSNTHSAHIQIHATQPPPPTPGTSNLHYMFQSLLAISSCTAGLLSIPPPTFTHISFLQWAQLATSIATLAQLESLHDPRINLSNARSVIDLPDLLDRVAGHLERTAEAARERHPDGVFTQLTAQVRGLRSTLQVGMIELERPGPGEVSGCGGGNVVVGPRTGYLRNSRFWMDQLFSAS